MSGSTETTRKWLVMAVLSVSGGIIFLLPFLQEVYYKPLAEAMNLSNTEVGSLMSAFGVTSMLCYFPGGWLADRVSPRKLITLSLLVTGALGLYFSTFPGYYISLAIHGFWGVTISLLFWGAMIRSTRNWAPSEDQGKAFGILESGRGIGEGLTSVALLTLFGWYGSGATALSAVVVLCSTLILSLGVLSWFVIDDGNVNQAQSEASENLGLAGVMRVLRMPEVWLISIIVLTAYCAYWGTFRLTPYATDVFLMSVTVAGTISVAKMFLKPIAAFATGYASDKYGIAKTIAVLFVGMFFSFLLFAFLPGSAGLLPLMLVNVAVISIGVYAIRGIYFALLDEGGIPIAVTGTAAGIVSVVGFTPDIFMPLLGGILVDQYPGSEGYRYFFLTTAGLCVVGFIATLILYRNYIRD